MDPDTEIKTVDIMMGLTPLDDSLLLETLTENAGVWEGDLLPLSEPTPPLSHPPLCRGCRCTGDTKSTPLSGSEAYVCVRATNAAGLSASQCAEDTLTWDLEAPRPLAFRVWDSGRSAFVRTGCPLMTGAPVSSCPFLFTNSSTLIRFEVSLVDEPAHAKTGIYSMTWAVRTSMLEESDEDFIPVGEVVEGQLALLTGVGAAAAANAVFELRGELSQVWHGVWYVRMVVAMRECSIAESLCKLGAVPLSVCGTACLVLVTGG